MITECAILLSTIVFLWFLVDNYFPSKKSPPGPLRLPLLENSLELLVNRPKPPFVIFQELSKKYGPLCYIRFGFREVEPISYLDVLSNVVLIDDFETAKQILNNEIWVDRPFHPRTAERSFGKPLGIIFVSGEGWKEMRRFSMRTLRDFGYGKQTNMQAVIEDEVKALLSKVEEAASQNKGNLEIKHLFTMPVLNILWSMVSNIRTAEDEVRLQELIMLVHDLAQANPIGGNILTIFPFLRHIFPEWTGHNFARQCHAKLQKYFREVLDKRRNEGSYVDDKRDFIDMFIQEIDKHKQIGSAPNHYTDEQFITTITDLFEAGSETSSNTMEFAIYFSMKNPSVQEKIQEEIERVIGNSRCPTMADRLQMPYTEATLLEVQRMSNVLPMTVRCPTEDCTLNGFDITKGTLAVVNMYSIHMDSSFWTDPYTFRPDRFLDSQSRIIPGLANRVIPFGAGKRVCLGEQMARTSMFIYFTSLLQHYTFIDTSSNGPKSKGFSEHKNLKDFVDVGFTLSPKPYVTKVVKRP